MTFLKKIQTSNLFYRKLIFWVIIIILATVSGILFFKNSKNRLQDIKKNSFLENLPILNFDQKIREIWPEEIGQRIKKEFNNIREILNVISEAVKEGQEK